LNTNILFGYEYEGSNCRSIITPLSERVYRSII